MPKYRIAHAQLKWYDSLNLSPEKIIALKAAAYKILVVILLVTNTKK